MTTQEVPIGPCTEIAHPSGKGSLFIDLRGRCWTVDSRRMPEFDALPDVGVCACGLTPEERARLIGEGAARVRREADSVARLSAAPAPRTLDAAEVTRRLAELWTHATLLRRTHADRGEKLKATRWEGNSNACADLARALSIETEFRAACEEVRR